MKFSNHFQLKDLDVYSKKVGLYYSGKEKFGSTFGLILTLLNVIICFGIFIIYAINYLSHIEPNLSEGILSPEIIPEIKLNKDLFMFAFAVENATTYEEIIDESIYQPKAVYIQSFREGNEWKRITKNLELIPCNLNKFGNNYQKLFTQKPLQNLYCLKNIDLELKGNMKFDSFSYIDIEIYPCINSSSKVICKTKENIEKYLGGTFLSIQLENTGLSPDNYTNPYQPTNEDMYTSIGKNFFRDYSIFLQIFETQTDIGILTEKFKKERFLKIENQRETFYMTEGNKFNSSLGRITIRLSDTIHFQKRIYKKISDCIAFTGGYIQLITSIFRIISILPINFLYGINLINDLFTFDIKKCKIILKKELKNKNNNFPNYSYRYLRFSSMKKLEIMNNLEFKNFSPIKKKSVSNCIKNLTEIHDFKKDNKNFIDNFIDNSVEIKLNSISNDNIKNKLVIYKNKRQNDKIEKNEINKEEIKHDEIRKEEINKDYKYLIDSINLKFYEYFALFCNLKKKKFKNSKNTILFEEGIKFFRSILDVREILKYILFSNEISKLLKSKLNVNEIIKDIIIDIDEESKNLLINLEK